jgi:superfamily II DNA/RNA helicase
MLALFDFCSGRNNLLITTDITSRGLNFGKEVDTIISFDMDTKKE